MAMPHKSRVAHTTKKSQNKQQQQGEQPSPAEQRDEANKRRFIDQNGVEARDLPGSGRDTPETDVGKEAKRNLPQQHGGEIAGVEYSEGGMRGDRDISDADDHCGRKRN
jgi:hypothetical protein